jgi:hypothetical protein
VNDSMVSSGSAVQDLLDNESWAAEDIPAVFAAAAAREEVRYLKVCVCARTTHTVLVIGAALVDMHDSQRGAADTCAVAFSVVSAGASCTHQLPAGDASTGWFGIAKRLGRLTD